MTLAELEALPTLAQGQADDLKLEVEDESAPYRVWLCRCGKEDGMPYDNQVTVERCYNGRWEEVARYEAR